LAAACQRHLAPEGLAAGDLVALIERRLPGLGHGRRQRLERTFYDTFDWRLHAADSVLEHARPEQTLVWRSLDGGLLGRAVLERAPRFAWELTPGALRKRLERVIEVRALLPQARVLSRLQALEQSDTRGKRVLSVVVEESRLAPGHGRGVTPRLGVRLELAPVTGYEDAFAAALDALSDVLETLRPASELLLDALAAEGRSPACGPTRRRLALDPDERSDSAVKRVLLALLETMERNESGARENLDTEFLHDYRVALRRTRSVLAQMKRVFPAPKVARFRRELAWIANLTGPVRDLDVYLLELERGAPSLPELALPELAPLTAFLHAEHRRVRRRLERALDGARYRKLRREWRAFLEAPPPRRTRLRQAAQPIARVARKRTARLYRRALDEGQAIDEHAPAEHLHELRKTCKKLRYLLELFATLYPGDELKRSVRPLKRVQDNLGAIQDLAVQSAMLETFRARHAAETRLPPATWQALADLEAAIDARRQALRTEFGTVFGRFATRENRHRFAALLAVGAGAAGDESA